MMKRTRSAQKLLRHLAPSAGPAGAAIEPPDYGRSSTPEEIMEKYSAFGQIEGIPALEERILVKVNMGQGAVADLRMFVLKSGAFSTCTPVLMFNKTYLVGGLFHYAAGRPSQANELRAMYNEVEPTTIWIGGVSEDIPYITSILKRAPGSARRELIHDTQPVRPLPLGKSGERVLYLDDSGEVKIGNGDFGYAAKILDLTMQDRLPAEIEEAGKRLGIPLILYHNPEGYAKPRRGAREWDW